jgi:AraC-like DNA-binding protein
VSPSYISRLFSEGFGTNYHRYVKEKRMAIAMELLCRDMDISAIAIAAGYDCDVTFRRAFKHYMGVSPSEYRKHYKVRHA